MAIMIDTNQNWDTLTVGTNLNTRYSWQSDKNQNQYKNKYNTNIGGNRAAGEQGESWWYISIQCTLHSTQH